MSKETDTKVANFLEEIGVQFKVRLAGETKRDDWVCDEWRVSFKNARIDFSTEYYTGVGHRVDTPVTRLARIHLKNVSRNSIAWHEHVLNGMKPQTPVSASVLYSLLADGNAIDRSFTDWCDEAGYDTDSRKALATYETCCETGRKMRKLFTREQRDTLSEMLQGY